MPQKLEIGRYRPFSEEEEQFSLGRLLIERYIPPRVPLPEEEREGLPTLGQLARDIQLYEPPRPPEDRPARGLRARQPLEDIGLPIDPYVDVTPEPYQPGAIRPLRRGDLGAYEPPEQLEPSLTVEEREARARWLRGEPEPVEAPMPLEAAYQRRQATPYTSEQFAPEKTLGHTVADVATELTNLMPELAREVGITGLKGTIGVPEAAVGVADIFTLGYAGKLLEQAGYEPGEARRILETGYGEKTKQAYKEFAEAEGVVDKAIAALTNPRIIAHTVGEALPLMLAGGAVGRGVAALAPRLAAGAAGIGEGVVTAGGAAEQTRQQAESGLLTPGQAGLALSTGVVTGGLGYLGGRIADQLGIGDIDTMIVAAQRSPKASRSLAIQLVYGAVQEGLLEELPQSVQEQVHQNYATGRPLMEGVADSAVLGALAGAVMGGGAQVVRRLAGEPEPPPSPRGAPPPGAPPELAEFEREAAGWIPGPEAPPVAPALEEFEEEAQEPITEPPMPEPPPPRGFPPEVPPPTPPPAPPTGPPTGPPPPPTGPPPPTTGGPRWHPDSQYQFDEEGDVDPQRTLDMTLDGQTRLRMEILSLEDELSKPARTKKAAAAQIKAEKVLDSKRDHYEGTWGELEANILGIDVDALRQHVEARAGRQLLEAAGQQGLPVEEEEAPPPSAPPPGAPPVKALPPAVSKPVSEMTDEEIAAMAAEIAAEVEEEERAAAPKEEAPTEKAAVAIPLTFQRYDKPGAEGIEKVHGLYTTPAGVDSPHADVGDQRLWQRAEDANVLDVSQSSPIPLRKMAIDSGTGVHALRQLVGEDEFNRLKGLTTDDLHQELQDHGVYLKDRRYFDEQEYLEALGAVKARQAGYDGIWRGDPDPRWSEYVGLTSKGLQPVGGEAPAPSVAEAPAPPTEVPPVAAPSAPPPGAPPELPVRVPSDKPIETRTNVEGFQTGDTVRYDFQGEQRTGTISDPGQSGMRARIKQANGTYIDRWPSDLIPVNFKWATEEAPAPPPPPAAPPAVKPVSEMTEEEIAAMAAEIAAEVEEEERAAAAPPAVEGEVLGPEGADIGPVTPPVAEEEEDTSIPLSKDQLLQMVRQYASRAEQEGEPLASIRATVESMAGPEYAEEALAAIAKPVRAAQAPPGAPPVKALPPAPAAAPPERTALIERIVAASRRPEPEAVEVFETKGTDGKWYRLGMPHGVQMAEPRENRSAGWVVRTSEGTTVGSRYPSKEALLTRWREGQDRTDQEFRGNLETKSDQELETIAKEVAKTPPKPALEAKPSAPPPGAPGAKAEETEEELRARLRAQPTYLKVGERVSADEGVGTVHAFDGGTRNVKIALEPKGELTKWIPVDRVRVLPSRTLAGLSHTELDKLAVEGNRNERRLAAEEREARRKGPIEEYAGKPAPPVEAPAPDADLEARKAANKAKREAIFKELRAKGSSAQAGVDPTAIVQMVKLIGTYVDDGIVEFDRAWRQFRKDFELADRYARAFEKAWLRLRGETKAVADVAEEPDPTIAPEDHPANTRIVRLFEYFRDLSLAQWPANASEARKLAESVAGEDLREATDEIVDAMEGALTIKFRHEVALKEYLLSQIAAARTLESHLPRAWRSLEKTDLQQFSTPLPIAAAVQWVAQQGQQPTDRILEPTAGTGHLIASLTNVKAHELSPRRAGLLGALGFDVTQGDYLEALDLKESFDIIVANPPWGKFSTGKYGAAVGLRFTPRDVAERFVGKMIRDLKPGGRLVVVMPTTMMSSPEFRQYLAENGVVRGLIQSPPGAYTTRATTVDSILLVWDKGAKGTPSTFVEPKTWDAYAEAVAEIPPREIRLQRPPGDTPPGRPPRTPGAPHPPPGQGAVGPGGKARPGTAPRPDLGVPERRDTDVVADEPGGEREELEPQGAPTSAPRPDQRATTRGLSDTALVAHGHAQASQQFAPYHLRTRQRGVRHPKLVVEARSLAGVNYPDLTETFSPRVARIVREGRVSIEQAEQALAAVQANAVGHHGYLAADNVGVGKSREIALTILELMERAKKAGNPLRLLVTTKSKDNIADLIDREMLEEVLQKEDPGFEIVRVSEMKASRTKKTGEPREPLPQFEHAIYVTDFSNLAPYLDSLTEVGLNGIIGDEAHKFKNQNAKVGAAWQRLHADIMLHTPREQQAFAYFTATPAQSVYDYQYLYGLRLWPVDGFQNWVMLVTGRANEVQAAAIQAATEQGAHDLEHVATNATGNVVGSDSADVQAEADEREAYGGGEDVFSSRLTPAEAEQIPREWKMQGRFSARDLWREGTEFIIHTYALTPEHTARYDAFAKLSRDIIDASYRVWVIQCEWRRWVRPDWPAPVCRQTVADAACDRGSHRTGEGARQERASGGPESHQCEGDGRHPRQHRRGHRANQYPRGDWLRVYGIRR